MITYFVVQSFQKGKKGQLLADEPIQATSAKHAARLADKLAQRKAGVVTFSRTGEPKTGDWEDAQILAIQGAVPEEVTAERRAA